MIQTAMTQAAIVLCVIFALLVLGQALLGLGFVVALWRSRCTIAPDNACPKAAVVLCLRGTDPFLPRTVEAILDFDYPRYEVRVVVDHRDDPAWRVVEQVVQRRGATNVRIEPLDPIRTTCGLKCSSVTQAIAGLDESFEVVALVDADTVPHRTWLRELVAPLADERVGATTGNRWYMPADGAQGSLVRYLWNACAVVQMYWYEIPWGGTLAIKTSVIRETGVLDRWRKAFCEDTMLYRVLREHGRRVAFVPSLMMVNREASDLGGFFRWVRRQLLTARLYHPGWPAVIGHGLLTSLMLLIGVVLFVAALATGETTAALWTGGGLLTYFAALFPLLPPMELAVRRIAAARSEPTGWLSPRVALGLLVAIPLTSIVYAAALVSAITIRVVDWRGVSYEIASPWDIRMIEYRPYADDAASTYHSL